MPAKFIPIGTPAHDAERQAIRYLVQGLTDDYTVYGNPWLVDRSGVITDLDAVVVAPHGVFVVEIKSYRGRIEGTDNDWWVRGVPEQTRSPLKVNRKTAQLLKQHLRDLSYEAGQVWVEGFVFLSATSDVAVRGPASTDRVHTRKSILGALTTPALMDRLSQKRATSPSAAAVRGLHELFTGTQQRSRGPIRSIREYEIREALEHHDTYAELLGVNTLSSESRVLRVYGLPELATDAERERVELRARWEAQVLARLGRIDGVLRADPPFKDEVGIVLPLEAFKGITLTTWLERYGRTTRGKEHAEIETRVKLWGKIARTIDAAHAQGVVHRLLRPEVILVEDRSDPNDLRITGFDLAKQLASDATIAISSVSDERLIYAAPEVVSAFSSAEPASDQFSLGAILALILTGQPLFENTRALLAAGGRLMRRVRDKDHRIPLSLDEATGRMLQMQATDRFPSLAEAIDAVFNPGTRLLPGVNVQRREVTLDPDDLVTGTRIGTDYEIEGRLGQGGMSVVYAAKHLVSGRTRALKVARGEPAAEDALHGEFKVLSELDHPNIVRIVDLSKMVEGRLTLVMERVGGQTLRSWLGSRPPIDAATQRRLAEDLLAGLDYLEQKGVTHKDIKPENLLVHDGHLTIIDFNLAASPEDAPFGGTALYRDPASARWTHGTDRYAAALCLFELYAGHHAFDGRVPEPGVAPAVQEEDISPSGLATFFRNALNPSPERRHPSARAMRDALLRALGEDVPVEAVPDAAAVDSTTPLRITPLSRRAVNALARAHVTTVGELLTLPPSAVQALHAIGTKTAADIIAFQTALRERGLSAAVRPVVIEPPLFAELRDAADPVSALQLSEPVATALKGAGFETVGDVASSMRSVLLALSGMGNRRVAEVVRALDRYQARTGEAGSTAPHTLDGLWELATRPLGDGQRIAIERCLGLNGVLEIQGLVAEDLGRSQSQVSIDLNKGLERLDMAVLAPLSAALDDLLDHFSGITRIDDLGARLEEQWPAGDVVGVGIVRVLVRLAPGTALILELDGVEAPVVARPMFDRETLRAFVAEVYRVAGTWPPVEPDSARRALTGLLPHFQGNPVSLGIRLCHDVCVAETGHLFIPPLEAKDTLGFVLDRIRDPLSLEELEREVKRVFGDAALFPDRDNLVDVLHQLEWHVQGDRVISGSTSSVLAPPPMEGDPSNAPVVAERSPEEAIRDMLSEAAGSRGFRMLVTPPKDHREIARSVAHALSATWLSFDDEFFADHAAALPSLERAERFVAQRGALTDAAEHTLFRLLEEHGEPGRTLVLGDTGLLGLCDALDLPRRLYDETMSGNRGFWVLVVPGVIHKRQPRFNEGPALWHLEGATISLLHPLPSPSPAP